MNAVTTTFINNQFVFHSSSSLTSHMKNLLFLLSILITCAVKAQQVIPLYNGTAPGSETWNWQEQEIQVDYGTVIMAVSRPTLTAFVPDHPNGTAVIIAPGGAFHALAWNHEGTEVAKRLNAKGITAFVLKYRLVYDDPAHPENSIGNLMRTGNFKTLDSLNKPVVPLALQDGLQAVKYVRSHAATYHIAPDKIGFMGFCRRYGHHVGRL